MTARWNASGDVSPTEDPYSVLGVSRESDDQTIRQAYLQLVREHPPERDRDAFQRIRTAYEVLRTPEGRSRALVEVPQAPPGDSVVLTPPQGRPHILGFPLDILFGRDPWAVRDATELEEDVPDA